MANKWVITFLLVIALAMGSGFGLLMRSMSQSMEEMTVHMATMSKEVGEMGKNLHTMNDTMLRIEKSVSGMERSMNVGSQQMQQLNPSNVMQQLFQGQPRR